MFIDDANGVLLHPQYFALLVQHFELGIGIHQSRPLTGLLPEAITLFTSRPCSTGAILAA